jgi:hypothetical protein
VVKDWTGCYTSTLKVLHPALHGLLPAVSELRYLEGDGTESPSRVREARSFYVNIQEIR